MGVLVDRDVCLWFHVLLIFLHHTLGVLFIYLSLDPHFNLLSPFASSPHSTRYVRLEQSFSFFPKNIYILGPANPFLLHAFLLLCHVSEPPTHHPPSYVHTISILYRQSLFEIKKNPAACGKVISQIFKLVHLCKVYITHQLGTGVVSVKALCILYRLLVFTSKTMHILQLPGPV